MFFDIAWSEILVIGVVATVAIGPKELPQVMRTVGRLFRRAQYLKFAMSRQFEDFMREHELEELRRGVHPHQMFKDSILNEDYMTGVNFEAGRKRPASDKVTDLPILDSDDEADADEAHHAQPESPLPPGERVG